jgi:hypothetical protein
VKVVLYSVILLLSVCILYLLSLMVDRPFSALNMTQAYDAGCTIGGINTPNETLIRCRKLSLIYGETLEELIDQ